MRPSRRTLLKYGFAGTAVLTMGGVGLSLWPSQLREPQRPLAVLTQREYSILAAVADRMTPAGGAFPSAQELQVAEKVDDLLAISDPATADELRMVLKIVENALVALLFGGAPVPFTALSDADRDRVLNTWRLSSVSIRRTAYQGLRSACLAAYYSSTEVYPLVGYPGPPDFSAFTTEEPL